MIFRFIGTGTSVGVPQIGCDCRVCTSADPRDRRRRCGAYVRSGETGFLIDTPPEMRLAAIEYGIRRVDAIVLTHAHMDHVAGFDDVRRFNTLNGGTPLRCHAMPETVEAMHHIFPYITAEGNAQGLFRPQITFASEPTFVIGDLRLERFEVSHGYPCCGYLIGSASDASIDRSLAYVSDCHEIPDAAVERLRGVDTLVINCLRVRPHPTHLNLEALRDYLSRIAPRRAYVIHMCHDYGHADWCEMLAGTCAEPAYDGLEITVGE